MSSFFILHAVYAAVVMTDGLTAVVTWFYIVLNLHHALHVGYLPTPSTRPRRAWRWVFSACSPDLPFAEFDLQCTKTHRVLSRP